MSLGLGNTSAYQVSGAPWVTSSYITTSVNYIKVVFPRVTKSVTITNIPADGVFPFTLTGSAPILFFFGPDLTGTYPPLQVTHNHCTHIPTASFSSSVKYEVKCSQVFIAKKYASTFAAFHISAELTNIPVEEMYVSALQNGLTASIRDGFLTGSGIDQ